MNIPTRQRALYRAILRITALPLLLAFVPLSGHAEALLGRCTGVSDGDTIQLTTPAKATYKIRLSGIDAPEKKQAYGQKAKEALSGLCYGKEVRAEVHDKDRYGRLVADLYDGTNWLNAILVQTGFAWHYTQYSKSTELAGYEASARKQRLGLWADPHPTAPWDFRRASKNTEPGQGIRPAIPKPQLSGTCGTCKTYKTCVEATAALKSGCRQLDDDGDGQPCEALCQ